MTECSVPPFFKENRAGRHVKHFLQRGCAVATLVRKLESSRENERIFRIANKLLLNQLRHAIFQFSGDRRFESPVGLTVHSTPIADRESNLLNHCQTEPHVHRSDRRVAMIRPATGPSSAIVRLA